MVLTWLHFCKHEYMYNMYYLHTFLCWTVVVCFLGCSRLSHVMGKNPFLVGNQRCRAGKVTFLFGSLLRCIIPKTSLWYHWGAVHHSWYLQNIISFIFQHLPPITLYTRNGKNSLQSFIKQKVNKTYLKIHLKSLFHLCFIEFLYRFKGRDIHSPHHFFREMFHLFPHSVCVWLPNSTMPIGTHGLSDEKHVSRIVTTMYIYIYINIWSYR